MKKKRLFAIFAAFAVAATMAIGFTACNDNNNDNCENETLTGDDSVLTEEQWIQAWADTRAAKNIYGNELFTQSTEMISFGHSSSSSFIKYDAEAYNAYITGGEINGSPLGEKYYEYYEVSSKDLIRYKNVYNYEWIDSGQVYEQIIESEYWVKEIIPFETDDLAKAYFNSWWVISCSQCWLLFEDHEWKGAEGSSVQGKISELFELFTYNEITHSYSANLYGEDYNEDNSHLNLIVSFRDGKLYNVNYEFSFSQNSDMYYNWTMECTLSYGGVSITIPEDVKANAEVWK